MHANHVVIDRSGQREVLRFPEIKSLPQPRNASPSTSTRLVDSTSSSERRELVRQRLEELRQRALRRT